MSMNPIDQLDTLIPTFTGLAGRVETADLERTTPCSDWQVRDLLNHIAGGAPVFAGLFRGEAGRPFPTDDQLGDEPSAAVRRALDEFDAAVKSPGAMERPLETPFGEMPGEAFARLAAVDLMIHSWDLATALGERLDLDNDLVREVDAFARSAFPDPRPPALFAPAVEPPDGASPLECLVAFSGRTV